ncbi:MAG: hypothetical protein CEE38_23420 [Planctomycetes bacterium B3_Pla]|nr:MAG: hypothetical protein CEE38_23420 [Planctomycetes bacterium B3_Pla]
MVDTIIQGKTRRRREFCAFYTNSDPILTYMVERLRIEAGDVILEPCAGDGVFIDKIIERTAPSEFTLDAVDLNPQAVAKLKQKFGSHSNITVRKADILLEPSSGLFTGDKSTYTRVIGNPPYGAWQDHDRRKLLKELYGGYVRETYTLFIRRCCQLLKDNGRLVFIVPDTFLALHLHKELRRYLVRQTKIEEILLFPSHFFPGVNFGYSNLCIITVVKSANTKDVVTNIVTVSTAVDKIYQIAKGNYNAADYHERIRQKDVAESEDFAFLIGVEGNTRIRDIIRGCKLRLGDIADCVTGFYSGNNQDFLAVGNHAGKNTGRYRVVPPSEIEHDFINKEDVLSGLTNEKKYIPIVKGAGPDRFSVGTNWFVRWDKKTVDFYQKDRKARFQNPRYYFKEGIGVPMVRSSKARAFLLEKRLFDQSIVGVFPRRNEHLNYLLAFLNSDIFTKLLNAINHTANSSANYLKKIPILLEERAITQVNSIMESQFATRDTEGTLKEINDVFNSLFEIPTK